MIYVSVLLIGGCINMHHVWKTSLSMLSRGPVWVLQRLYLSICSAIAISQTSLNLT